LLECLEVEPFLQVVACCQDVVDTREVEIASLEIEERKKKRKGKD